MINTIFHRERLLDFDFLFELRERLLFDFEDLEALLLDDLRLLETEPDFDDFELLLLLFDRFDFSTLCFTFRSRVTDLLLLDLSVFEIFAAINWINSLLEIDCGFLLFFS